MDDTPIDIKNLHQLTEVKKREVRKIKASYRLDYLKYSGVYLIKRTGKRSRLGKFGECRVCGKRYILDGRPLNVCNYHFDTEVDKRLEQGKMVSKEAMDFAEKIKVTKNELEQIKKEEQRKES